MPLLDVVKDPETGKIKPVAIIAGGGIAVVGALLVMSKGSSGSAGSQAPSSGVASAGQSGENTSALNDLMDAILSIPAGAAGAKGATGLTGAKGATGAIGPTGHVTIPSNTGGTSTSPGGTQTKTTTSTISSVTALKTARLFRLDTATGLLRPVISSSGSYTFSSSVGSLLSKKWTADTQGPYTTPVNTAQFRQITSGVHKGEFIRVTDTGYTYK